MNRETTPRAPLDYASLPPIDLSHADIITDDTAAREFLAAEGMLGRLEPEPPYDTCSVSWRSANTHAYCHAVNSHVAGDSGYVIVCLPEAHYKLAEATLLFAEMMQDNNLAPGTEKSIWAEPEHN